MKNFKIFKLINTLNALMSILVIILLSGCGNEDLDSCSFDGCDSRRKTIKNAKNEKGRVSILSQQYPDVWVIVFNGIIGEYIQFIDGPDIVLPCNMVDSLKVQDLKVLFSGALKESCGDFDLFVSELYYSSLTEIIVQSKKE